MNRKPKLAPRNPLVAPSMFRKAGTHGKPYKALRRAEKVVLGGVAQRAEHPAFTRMARVRASPPPPPERDCKRMTSVPLSICWPQ